MLEAVIFDHDGTLAPTHERQEAWFKVWSNLNKVEWRFDNTKAFMKFYNHHVNQDGGVQNVYDALGLPCDMNDRSHPVWPAYETFNQQNPHQLYPGAKETIKAVWEMSSLGKNWQQNRRTFIGINTTNSWKSIYKDLDQGGVLPYIDIFITEEILGAYHGDNGGHCIKKPSTISIAKLLDTLHVDGSLTLHVGDTLHDLRASHKVMRLNPAKPETLITVGACYGYEGRKLLENGYQTADGIVTFDYLIDNITELVPIVKKLM